MTTLTANDPRRATEDEAVAVCQTDYCAEEHCDLGGGICRKCSASRAGYRICGYCGLLWHGGLRACKGGTVTTIIPVTPVQVDTMLAALYEEQQRLIERLHQAVDGVHHAARDRRMSVGGHRLQVWSTSLVDAKRRAAAIAETDEAAYRRADARRALDAEIAARAAVDANRATQAPLHAEYDRRRWTRAFLVVTSGHGHVHSSMSCSTCYPTTRYHWFPHWSGRDEAEIVAAAGERACTVCYPSAPVETRSLPSQFFTADERAAQAERERRAALGPKPTCPRCGRERPRTKRTMAGERVLCSDCQYEAGR